MTRNQLERAAPRSGPCPVLLGGGQGEDTPGLGANQSKSGPVVIATLRKNARESLRVALGRFQGVDLIDIRVTVDLTASSGIQTPTKKGVSLRVGMLPDLIEALQKAQAIASGGRGACEARHHGPC